MRRPYLKILLCIQSLATDSAPGKKGIHREVQSWPCTFPPDCSKIPIIANSSTRNVHKHQQARRNKNTFKNNIACSYLGLVPGCEVFYLFISNWLMKPWICYNRKSRSFIYCCFLLGEIKLKDISINVFTSEETAKITFYFFFWTVFKSYFLINPIFLHRKLGCPWY